MPASISQRFFKLAAAAAVLLFLLSGPLRAWTDDPLPEKGQIRRIHVMELRSAIDSKRAACSLGAYSWADPGLPSGTPIRKVHIDQLRAALSGMNSAVTSFYDPEITAKVTKIQRIHIMQLRQAVDAANCGCSVSDLVIAADTMNYNLKAAVLAAGWDGACPVKAKVTINAGVKVGSANTASFAFVTGSFPSGAEVRIVNNGYIVGAGGAGGDGCWPDLDSTCGAIPASPGGPALSADSAVTVVNNGVIGGGGGGGGGGWGNWSQMGGAGAGGAGYMPGAGCWPVGYLEWHLGPPANAGDGTLTTGGLAQAAGELTGGPGGNGGSLGQAGIEPPLGFSGGAAGAAVVGNGNITWSPLGTVYGARY